MAHFICHRAGAIACTALLAAWTPSALSQAAVSRPIQAQSLDTIITQTLEASPELKAAQAEVVAARARLAGAEAPLNNPEVSGEFERTDVNTYVIGLSQAIDWRNKRAAREKVSQLELEVAQAQVAELRLAKGTELALRLSRLATRDEIVSLSSRRTEILERFVGLAEQRHAAGDIAQAELELARLARSEAILRHAEQSAELIKARSDLFAISGKQLNAKVEFPQRVPAEIPDTFDIGRAAAQHPRLQVLHLAARAARQNIRAVDKERKADPTVGIGVGREGKTSLLSVSFSMPLQVRNDFSSGVEAASAEALAAEQVAQQVYRDQTARMDGAREGFNLVAGVWRQWASTGSNSLQEHLKLLDRQWRAGEMTTTDYLLQVDQMLDTQISAAELHGRVWGAWLEWLGASGNLIDGLNEMALETESK